MEELIKEIIKSGKKIALAESITAGRIASTIAEVPGASRVLVGSFAVYSPEIKRDVLGVPQKIIDIYTCESSECTRELLYGLKRKVNADIYLAVTGVAGPDSMPGGCPGTYYMAVMENNEIEHLIGVVDSRKRKTILCKVTKLAIEILNEKSKR